MKTLRKPIKEEVEEWWKNADIQTKEELASWAGISAERFMHEVVGVLDSKIPYSIKLIVYKKFHYISDNFPNDGCDVK